MRDLQRFDGFRKTCLHADGSAYQVGEILRQPQLASTLRLIAKDGASAFYTGPIAQKIVEDLRAHGGVLTAADFAAHHADWVKPISADYRGYTAYNFPPNTQGLASLGILNVLNNFDVRSLGEGTADYYHLMAEATKQSFADRDKYLSDPEFVKIPLDYILSSKHGQDLAKRIDMKTACASVKPLDPNGDSVWLDVVDSEGNAVSLILAPGIWSASFH